MNHIPVLENEIVNIFSYLSAIKDTIFVDGTIGNAGHSISIAKKTGTQVIAIDKDQSAINLSKKNISSKKLSDSFTFIHDDFKNLKNILDKLSVDKINGALLDLGVSSMQLDDTSRGFSFKNPDEELDMRMDQSQTFSAKDVVNGYSKFDLLKILRDYGEEKHAKRIVDNIASTRKEKPIKTVGDLLYIVEKSIPKKKQFGKIHFATRTFQAIRIETNNELDGLGKSIIDFCDVLSPSSKFVIISFHSLEDRIVKQTFFDLANPCKCPKDMPCACNKKPIIKIETKKPIVASNEEVLINPRSRSAKLRIFQKLSSS
jgi:16S rRNA (cytosine1402-N4)-methyltransferase